MGEKYIATIGGESRSIPAETAGMLRIRNAAWEEGGGGSGRTALLDVSWGGRSYRICARSLAGGETEIWVDRYRVVVGIQDEREAELGRHVHAAAGVETALRVKAPMPGLIKEILVKVGEDVKKGQRLLTLEAMKMENEIQAPGDGRVGKFDLRPGISVEKDQILIELKKT